MTSNLRTRVVAMSVLSTLVVLGTAACGGGSSGPEFLTSDPPTAAITLPSNTGIAVTPFLNQVTAAMIGSGSADVALQSAAESAIGRFTTQGARTDFDIAVTVPASGFSNLEMRIVNGVSYVAVPGSAAADKFFILPPGNSSVGGLLTSLTAILPSSTLIKLAPAVRNVADLGPVTIGGDRTEHYVLLIDTAKSKAALSTSISPPSSVTSKVPETIRYNLYITKDYLVRRVHISVLGKPLTVDYTHWGRVARIDAPSKADLIAAPAGF
ncbi:MAG TPA: hypothetical protein VFE15_02475 [Marmoricola sp.]|nr:hypothetical protein [Marmoricola sp.]